MIKVPFHYCRKFFLLFWVHFWQNTLCTNFKSEQGSSGRRRPQSLKPFLPVPKLVADVQVFANGYRGLWEDFWDRKEKSQGGNEEFGNSGPRGRRRPAEASVREGMFEKIRGYCEWDTEYDISFSDFKPSILDPVVFCVEVFQSINLNYPVKLLNISSRLSLQIPDYMFGFILFFCSNFLLVLSLWKVRKGQDNK